MIRFLYIIIVFFSKMVFILFWLTGVFNSDNDMFNESRSLGIINNKNTDINIVTVPSYSRHINFFEVYITHANSTFFKKQQYNLNSENSDVIIEFDGNNNYYKLNDTLFKVIYRREFGYSVTISKLSEISNEEQEIKKAIKIYSLFFIIINLVWIILGYLYKRRYNNKSFLYFSMFLFLFYFVGDVIYIVNMIGLL